MEGHVVDAVHVPMQARYVHKVGYCIDKGIKTPAPCRVASVSPYRLNSFFGGAEDRRPVLSSVISKIYNYTV